jgi:hypothetical protein
VCFLLVELYSEKLSQLLESMLLVVENVVFVNSFHVGVLIFKATSYCFRVTFDMLAECAIVGAFKNVDQSFHFSIWSHFV